MTFHIENWYWVCLDTSPTTLVYSSQQQNFISNNNGSFLAWLADLAHGPLSVGGLAIQGMADNGAGSLIRVQLVSTANLLSGQKVQVGGQVGQANATGTWQVNVVDTTHVDLIGSHFNPADPWVRDGILAGATLTDSQTSLFRLLNVSAFETFTPRTFVFFQSSAADIVLTNPFANYNELSHNFTTRKVLLPPMNLPNSIPIGQPYQIKNTGGTSFTVTAQDGTTVITPLNTGEIATFYLENNTTANGTFKVNITPAAGGISAVHGLYAITTTTTLAAQCFEIQYRNAAGQVFIGATPDAWTVDITVAGPVANGRDQAGAFAAGNSVHVYWLYGPGKTSAGIASLQGPGFGPTLPTGYTAWCYLGTYVLDGSVHFQLLQQMGSRVYYNVKQNILTGGAATTYTGASFTGFVPSQWAVSIMYQVRGTASGGAATLDIGHTTGNSFHAFAMTNAAQEDVQLTMPRLPATTQVFYKWSVAGAADIWVQGYTVANGDG